MPDSEVGTPSRDWRRLLLAFFGPLGITLAYLVIMGVRGEESFAPGQGAGAARRTTMVYALYVAALLAFVIVGIAKCRRDVTKLAFAAIAIPASLVLMFVAFFSQMAP